MSLLGVRDLRGWTSYLGSTSKRPEPKAEASYLGEGREP